jgi:hypothetical protein
MDNEKIRAKAAEKSADRPSEQKSDVKRPEITIRTDEPKSKGGDMESRLSLEKSNSSGGDRYGPSGRTPTSVPGNGKSTLNVTAPVWKPNPNAATFTPVRTNPCMLQSGIMNLR